MLYFQFVVPFPFFICLLAVIIVLYCLSTMSSKSLGTLHVIYAVDEQQNSLPHKTMLFEGDANSTGGRNDVFPSSYGLRL